MECSISLMASLIVLSQALSLDRVIVTPPASKTLSSCKALITSAGSIPFTINFSIFKLFKSRPFSCKIAERFSRMSAMEVPFSNNPFCSKAALAISSIGIFKLVNAFCSRVTLPASSILIPPDFSNLANSSKLTSLPDLNCFNRILDISSGDLPIVFKISC